MGIVLSVGALWFAAASQTRAQDLPEDTTTEGTNSTGSDTSTTEDTGGGPSGGPTTEPEGQASPDPEPSDDRASGADGVSAPEADASESNPPAAEETKGPDAPEQFKEKSKEEPEEKESDDDLTWTLSAGGVLNQGNTNALQVNAGSRFGIRRDRHSFDSSLRFVAGWVGDEFEEKTAESLNVQARYDFFLSRMNALFVAVALRQDRFAGLSPRLQNQIGYMRNFFKREKHRLWAEVGYDLTFDNFDYSVLERPSEGAPDDQVVHAARLFLGYDNHINEDFTYLTGIEALFNVEDAEDIRINWNNALRTSLGGKFQAELAVLLQFDNVPVLGAERTDVLTQLNLLYNMF